ncbi:hypothetical protein [Mesorhizobium sp.]|nr:hypothetical protein [Mesorhizobium sp.]
MVGKPRYPVGISVATTNVNDRLIIASCWTQAVWVVDQDATARLRAA